MFSFSLSLSPSLTLFYNIIALLWIELKFILKIRNSFSIKFQINVLSFHYSKHFHKKFQWKANNILQDTEYINNNNKNNNHRNSYWKPCGKESKIHTVMRINMHTLLQEKKKFNGVGFRYHKLWTLESLFSQTIFRCKLNVRT